MRLLNGVCHVTSCEDVKPMSQPVTLSQGPGILAIRCVILFRF